MKLFKVVLALNVSGDLRQYSDGLRAGRRGFDFQQGQEKFFLFLNFQTGSGAHATSYTTGNCGTFPESKAAGA
jgi:hypothetical protein